MSRKRQKKTSRRNPIHTFHKKLLFIFAALMVLLLPILFVSKFSFNFNVFANPSNIHIKIGQNDPQKKLVFDGLEEDTTGECNGLLKVKNVHAKDGKALCTHGPDPVTLVQAAVTLPLP